jgi:hypothetical protein
LLTGGIQTALPFKLLKRLVELNGIEPTTS